MRARIRRAGCRTPARGVRPRRLAHGGRRALLRRERGRHRRRMRAAGSVRHRRAASPDLPHRRRAPGSARRAARRTGTALAQPRAPEERARRPRGARRASPRSSRTSSSSATSGRPWSAPHDTRPARPDTRRPGLPVRGNRLQGPHAAHRRSASTSPSRSGCSRTGRGRATPTSSSAPRRAASSSEPPSRTRSAPASSPRGSPASSRARPSRRHTRSSTARTACRSTATPFTRGARVIVLDDVLATGGTARAKVELVEEPRRHRRGRALRHRARLPAGPRAAVGLRRALARPVLSRTRPSERPPTRRAWPQTRTGGVHSRQGSNRRGSAAPMPVP